MAGIIRHSVRRCVLEPGAFLLHRTQVTQADDKRGRPKLTLADDPNIIVAWHPPMQQISIKRTKPTYAAPPSNTLTSAQLTVLEALLVEEPYVWDSKSLADLFEVQEEDVIENVQVPRQVRDKINAKEGLMSSWNEKDMQCMKVYQEKQRVKRKVELYIENRELFKDCTFDQQDLQLSAHFVGLPVPTFKE